MLGDPVTDLRPGGMEAGLGLAGVSKEVNAKVGGVSSSGTAHWDNTTLFFDYGVNAKSMLRVELSQVNTGIADTNGTEYGANYRFNLGSRQESPRPVTFGGLVGLYTGNISGSSYSGSYTEVEAAGGASLVVKPGLNAFFAAAFDSLQGTVTSDTLPKITFESKNPVGGYGGMEYLVAPDIRIGGELHIIFDTGWALYGLFRF
jgi:hypothetical protein